MNCNGLTNSLYTPDCQVIFAIYIMWCHPWDMLCSQKETHEAFKEFFICYAIWKGGSTRVRVNKFNRSESLVDNIDSNIFPSDQDN